MLPAVGKEGARAMMEIATAILGLVAAIFADHAIDPYRAGSSRPGARDSDA